MPAIPFPKRKVARSVALQELAILERTYPHAATALRFRNDFELLIAVILSAQCTDARVNVTTPVLFGKYPTPEKLAAARQADVEEIIRSCGFFRTKAKNIIACARDLSERFGGRVPRRRDQLESLAGVGRKTASVVLAAAFEMPALAVDTHVFRVSHRMGLTTGKTPRQVEEDVTALVPREKWGKAAHWLILHGRAICKAPVPRCPLCPVNHLCPTPAIMAKMTAVRARSNSPAAAAPRTRRGASAAKRA